MSAWGEVVHLYLLPARVHFILRRIGRQRQSAPFFLVEQWYRQAACTSTEKCENLKSYYEIQ